MAESDLRRCLDEMVEFIRTLPVDFDHCRDLSEWWEAVTRSVWEAAPPFIQRWPVLVCLLAAASSEQVIDFLVDLAIKSKCPLAYLSADDQNQLTEAGLSSNEQLLLARLRERFEDHDAET